MPVNAGMAERQYECGETAGLKQLQAVEAVDPRYNGERQPMR